MTKGTNTVFRAGAAEVDITPSIDLPMDGYLTRTSVNRGIHDPLMAQVLVLDDGPIRAAIIALDVLAVSASVTARLRRSLASVLSTTPDSIMICASHTHGGPSGLQDWFPIGAVSGVNWQLVELIEAWLTAAAQSALDRLVPARLAYAAGEIEGLGRDRNRDVSAPDPFVTALSIESQDRTPIAIVPTTICTGQARPTTPISTSSWQAAAPGRRRSTPSAGRRRRSSASTSVPRASNTRSN